MSTDRTCNAPPPQRASARAERRTWMTVGLTLATMVAELIAGSLTRSLALTADGWHMATHAGALGLSALAYWYARTRAHAAGFAFGTGKVHALAGFTNALLLLAVAASMVVEAVERFVHPERIRYTEALVVAVLGLGVNLVSAWLLQGSHAHHDHDHDHHDHDHHDHHDHNLRAAYLHVLADALTSVAAIVALALGRWLGWGFLDPLCALAGSVLIARWAVGLVRATSRLLLDVTPAPGASDALRAAVKAAGGEVVDLHYWESSPGHRACVLTVRLATHGELDALRAQLHAAADIDHLTVECVLTAPPSD
jgi:cation diffusion facilitator family transporter